MSRVLMVSSEATPYAKTGGLADVLGALPAALQRQGNEVAVVLPRYASVRLTSERVVAEYTLQFNGNGVPVTIFEEVRHGVPFYFVAHWRYDRQGLYFDQNGDFGDNHLRFAILCKAALEIGRWLFPADIVHGHDWQAGLLGPYLKHVLRGDPHFIGSKFVFTIHNLGYQGWFGANLLEELGLGRELMNAKGIEMFGQINCMRAGINFADVITTVSKAYAREIQTPEFGFGLEAQLRARNKDIVGILNGVDYGEWNPETDPKLPANFSADDLSGKQVCKQALLERFGLLHRLDRPLLGVVSRFAQQKGFDILLGAADQILDRDTTLVVLGNGESWIEDGFRNLVMRRGDRAGVSFGYNDQLAHLIEAGADMFLMPSHYEPCGLNQIYSLRYGTVPVVRATGGLDDTIDAETGFKFWGARPEYLVEAVDAALAAYQDRPGWERRMRTGMARDHSWDKAAAEYSDLYRRLRS